MDTINEIGNYNEGDSDIANQLVVGSSGKLEFQTFMPMVTSCCNWRWNWKNIYMLLTNQALNTLYNYSFEAVTISITSNCKYKYFHKLNSIGVKLIQGCENCKPSNNDFWITDPPYADAVNYHELGDFFLAWYDKKIALAFPEWYTESKAALP